MGKRFWLILLVVSLFLSGICCKRGVEKESEGETSEVESEELEEYEE